MPTDQTVLGTAAADIIRQQPGLTTHELLWQLMGTNPDLTYNELIWTLYRTAWHHDIGQTDGGHWYSVYANKSVAERHRLGLPACPYPSHGEESASDSRGS